MSKKIKAVFFADSHLGFDYPLRPRIKRRRRGKNFFRNFNRILHFAIKSKADFVIHGGDLFFRSKIPPLIIDKVFEILYRFCKYNIPLFIVPGNHERGRLPSSLFTGHDNLRIFDKPRIFRMEIKGAKIEVAGFPSVRNGIEKELPSILSKLSHAKENADINLLCMHQSIEGAKVGPNDYTFRKGPDVISKDSLNYDFTAILSGHIHRAQELSYNFCGSTIPILYPGSIERTSFAEKDEEKGFYILEFSCRDNEWHLSNKELIFLYSSPMIDLEIGNNLKNINEAADYLRCKLEALPDDAIISLQCGSDPINSLLTASLLRKLSKENQLISLKKMKM